MMKPDFATALRRADEELRSVDVPVGLADRIEQRGHRLPLANRSRLAPRLALAAAALCAVVLCIVTWRTAVLKSVGPTLLGGFVLGGASVDLVANADPAGHQIRLERGQCTLTDAALGAKLVVSGPLGLERRPDAIHVVRGRVEVQVEHRKAGASPARFMVSHGIIEVVGTRFTIDQGDGQGSVTLHEGVIAFHPTEGAMVTLSPGQSLQWPAPPTRAVPPAAVPSVSVPTSVTKRTISERLEHVEGLRSRGQWGRAASELGALLGEPMPSGTRERISYELGSIYSYQLKNSARACAHWRTHQSAYPRGRYGLEIEKAQRSLVCGDLGR